MMKDYTFFIAAAYGITAVVLLALALTSILRWQKTRSDKKP